MDRPILCRHSGKAIEMCYCAECQFLRDTRQRTLQHALQKHNEVPMVRKETPNPNISFLVIESHGAIAAGAMCTMTARPQVEAIKPYKLYIHPHLADKFTIQDIRVGNRSMFPQAQNLEAMQFSHGDGHEMKMDVVMCSQDVVMVVTNISGMMSPFRANWACYLPREMQRYPEELAVYPSRRRKKLPNVAPEYLLPTDFDQGEIPDTQEQIEASEAALVPSVVRPVRHQEQIEDIVPGPRSHLPEVPEHNRKPALQKQEPPGFGWDPGYGDD